MAGFPLLWVFMHSSLQFAAAAKGGASLCTFLQAGFTGLSFYVSVFSREINVLFADLLDRFVLVLPCVWVNLRSSQSSGNPLMLAVLLRYNLHTTDFILHKCVVE